VLAARLSDAKFFWENDLRVAKAGMDAWLEGLNSVTFHARLGSQADRIERIAALAREIAPMVGADAAKAEEAARIAKADLRSGMVGEFPELQGVMGRYYALAAGRDAEVADAARDHWRPMGAGDAVPTAPVSVAVSLADKIDTLTGFWAIDEKPTGSKDPFALRRAALGIIRILLDTGLKLPLDRFHDAQLLRHKIALNRPKVGDDVIDTLEEIVDEIADRGVFGAAYRAVMDRLTEKPAEGSILRTVGDLVPDLSTDLLAFFHDRLKVHLRDEGIRHDVIDAALSKPPVDDLALGRCPRPRVAGGAEHARRREPRAGLPPRGEHPDPGRGEGRRRIPLRRRPEIRRDGGGARALRRARPPRRPGIAPALAVEDFAAAMGRMAALRAPIDAFFEAVQVNAENQIVRRNRLNLLHQIVETCGQVADLSRIEG
jgi:glycyl-tRNA synthetase beta chain